MNPVVILAGTWLLVIGYGLLFVGYSNLTGRSISFQEAFFGRGSGVLPSPSKSGATAK